jgi:hypothetical protein
MRSFITEQLASRIVDEVLREAMIARPPETTIPYDFSDPYNPYKPTPLSPQDREDARPIRDEPVYDDGDPSTDPTFEDLFPYLAPYLRSPYSPGY